MMGTQLYPSRVFSHFREENGDEELSVLPRNTKVVVTGNNRTKSVLVGLHGVVKKAVGLGGWHWLVLKNGIEVKLQRNALSVVEHPTGDLEDSDIELFDSGSDSETGVKGNAYSTGFAFHKHSNAPVRYAKSSIRSTSSTSMNRSSYEDFQSIAHAPQPKVNLAKLGTKSLWRYCRHYNLAGIGYSSSRKQMLNAVKWHFMSQQLDEVKVIAEFVQAIRKKTYDGDTHI